VRITRFPALSEQQFQGCVSAFTDSLTGELNSAVLALRRLEGSAKGAAFAYEMAFDTHRYGALIVIDRWGTLVGAFGPHLAHPLAASAPGRIAAAEEILVRANRLVDAAERYGADLVEACGLAFQAAQSVFAPERALAAECAKLGPMLSEDYRSARQIFLEDLAAR
jgi:hypothetical protein